MSRSARVAPGNTVFHVLNRGVGRMKLFLKDGDFEAFERMLEKRIEKVSGLKRCQEPFY
jgi:hypothetical protein